MIFGAIITTILIAATLYSFYLGANKLVNS